MKKVLTLMVTAALGATLATSAMAQGAGPRGGGVQGGAGQRGPGGGRGKMMQELMAKITPPLSAAQKTKIEALNKTTMAEMKALRDKAGPGTDRSTLRPQFQKIQKERMDGLAKILTKAQLKSFQDAMAKLRKDHPGGPGGPGGKPGAGGKGGGGL